MFELHWINVHTYILQHDSVWHIRISSTYSDRKMCLILQGTPSYSPSCLGTSSASARLSQLFFFAGCPRFGESESCTGGFTRKCNNQASYILRATSLSLWGKYIWITLETNLSRTLRNSLWNYRIVEPGQSQSVSMSAYLSPQWPPWLLVSR